MLADQNISNSGFTTFFERNNWVRAELYGQTVNESQHCWSFTSDFKAALSALSEYTSEEDALPHAYVDFFRRFGTHVPTEAWFGNSHLDVTFRGNGDSERETIVAFSYGPSGANYGAQNLCQDPPVAATVLLSWHEFLRCYSNKICSAPTEVLRKELAISDDTLSNLDRALQAFNKIPSRFGNSTPTTTTPTATITPTTTATRTDVALNGAQSARKSVFLLVAFAELFVAKLCVGRW